MASQANKGWDGWKVALAVIAALLSVIVIIGVNLASSWEMKRLIAQGFSRSESYQEAERLFIEALADAQRKEANADDIIDLKTDLAQLYEKQKDFERAETLYMESLALLEQSLRGDHPNRAYYYALIADFYLGRKRYREAEPLYPKALAIEEKKLKPDDPELANTLRSLGQLYAEMKYPDKAKPLVTKAYEIDKRTGDNISKLNDEMLLLSMQASEKVKSYEEIHFELYIGDMQRKIRKNWHPPASNTKQRIVAIFKIDRQGKMSNLRITQSSGLQQTDDAARAAVQASSPFHPLPSEYKGKSVDVQFIFDYEIHKKADHPTL